jgi:Fe-S-cluster containining protein
VLAAHLQPTAYGLSLPRPGGLCVALEGERATAGPYRCRIYADRPRSCADFAVTSDACLEARRRVGLSR